MTGEMESELCYYDKNVRELTLFKWWLGLVGAWPLEMHTLSARIRWIFALCIEVFTSSSLTVDVIQHCEGWAVALDTLMMAGSSTVIFGKSLTNAFTWKYKRLLVESVAENWAIMRPSQHWLIMEKYSERARRIYMIFLLWCLSSAFTYMLRALPWHWLMLDMSEWNISAYRSYVHPVHCIWSDVSTPLYCLLNLQNCVELYFHTMGQTGSDSFMLMLSAHIAAQFHTLRLDFAALRAEGNLTAKNMKILVKKHKRLAYLSATLESAFNPNIFYQFFMSVILLCTEGFQVILCLSENDTGNVVKHTILICTLLTQLFLYSLAGQTLEEESVELCNAVYDAPWYDFDLNTMKDLPIIMLRASIPQQLTAGKFVIMNFFSFKDMLKASASYMSVLRAMLEAQ